MAMLDISAIFPNEAKSSEDLRKEEEMRQIALMNQGNPWNTLAGKSMANFNRNLTGGAYRATGNRGLLSSDQNFMKEMQSIDPRSPGADDAILEAAKKYAPEKVGALTAAMEQKRKTEFDENLRTRADERAERESNRADVRLAEGMRDSAFQRQSTNTRISQQWMEMGMARERLGLARRQLAIAEQSAARDYVDWQVDAGRDLQSAEARADLQSRYADMSEPEYQELAAALNDPTVSTVQVLQAAAQIEATFLRRELAEADSVRKDLGVEVTEADVDAYVGMVLDDLETNENTNFFGAITKEGGEDDTTAEAEAILRYYFKQAGKFYEPDVAMKKGLEYLRRVMPEIGMEAPGSGGRSGRGRSRRSGPARTDDFFGS